MKGFFSNPHKSSEHRINTFFEMIMLYFGMVRKANPLYCAPFVHSYKTTTYSGSFANLLEQQGQELLPWQVKSEKWSDIKTRSFKYECSTDIQSFILNQLIIQIDRSLISILNLGECFEPPRSPTHPQTVINHKNQNFVRIFAQKSARLLPVLLQK